MFDRMPLLWVFFYPITHSYRDLYKCQVEKNGPVEVNFIAVWQGHKCKVRMDTNVKAFIKEAGIELGAQQKNEWISLTWVGIIHSIEYPNKPKGRECWNTMPARLPAEWRYRSPTACELELPDPFTCRRDFSTSIVMRSKVLWCSLSKMKTLMRNLIGKWRYTSFWLYASWRTLINSPWKQCFKSIKKICYKNFKETGCQSIKKGDTYEVRSQQNKQTRNSFCSQPWDSRLA